MIKQLGLNNVGPFQGEHIIPSQEEFGERVNLLTGDNGLGKTFLLDLIWWILTGDRAGKKTIIPFGYPEQLRAEINAQITAKATGDKSLKFQFQNAKWNRPRARPHIPGLVIYMRVDGGFSVWDEMNNYWGKAESEDLVSRPAYDFTSQDVWNGLNEDGKNWCNGLISDWNSWQYLPAHREKFDILWKVIKELFPPELSDVIKEASPAEIDTDDTRLIPRIELPYGIVPLTHLSAGMRRVISLAYLLVWAWSNHIAAARKREKPTTHQIIFLADEIETHLYPKWQRSIVPAILNVVSDLGQQIPVQFFIATHSPLVLASMEPNFIQEQDKLFSFELDKNMQIKVDKVGWAKLGDVTNWLTSNIFDLDEARSVDAEAAIKAAYASMSGKETDRPQILKLPNGEEYDLNKRDEIHQALSELLSPHDSFWASWVIYRKTGITPPTDNKSENKG